MLRYSYYTSERTTPPAPPSPKRNRHLPQVRSQAVRREGPPLRIIIHILRRLSIDADRPVRILARKHNHIQSRLIRLIVPKRAADIERRPVKRKVHVREFVAHVRRDTIIKSEVPLRLARRVRGDDEVEWKLAVLVRGEALAGSEGDDRPSADVQGHRDVLDIIERDVATGAVDLIEGEEVVEQRVGDVERHTRAVLIDHRRNEQRRAVIELVLNRQRVRVVRVDPRQRPHRGRAVCRVLVQECVRVVEQAQARAASSARSDGRQVPAVELLRDVAELVVVAVERVECAKPGVSS